MPDIRYVCLSDTHLGEEDSLLTNLKVASSEPDLSRPSPVLEALIHCLRLLISTNKGSAKPTLILNGDILELALATTNVAAMAFERLLDLVAPRDEEPLFERVIYIPGNHDHHLWESARETQYVHYTRTLPSGARLPVPWHTTNLFVENDPNPVPSFLLNTLVRRQPGREGMSITVAYPNFGLLNDEGSRCVLFHHGHFTESIYQLMSTLKTLLLPGHTKPVNVYDLEAENFAWIDFFWSTMGRSGTVGQTAESIYERMHDSKSFKKLLAQFAENLAREYDLPGWGDWMESKLLQAALVGLADRIARRERTRTDSPLTEEAEKGLWAYVEGPLREQILLERDDEMPGEVSVVFGHTHKPFQEPLNFKGYPQWVGCYNTGGWIVESTRPEPIHGGAVVLVDEHLNLTFLRMYNEASSIAEYQVQVEQARHPGDRPNAFHSRIDKLVSAHRADFEDFSNTVARAVNVRAQNLRARMNTPDLH